MLFRGDPTLLISLLVEYNLPQFAVCVYVYVCVTL